MMKTENILNDSRLRALENHTRVNLLRPTLGTTAENGVTCTNNGDGTYTLNGTATEQTIFWFNDLNILSDGKRIVAFPPSSTLDIGYSQIMYSDGVWGENESGSGENLASGKIIKSFIFTIRRGVTVNNLLIKPMITDDLSATYDDFVSYDDSLVTGSSQYFFGGIDTSRVLAGNVSEYTATEDCWVYIDKTYQCYVTIDGINIANGSSQGWVNWGHFVPMRIGQKLVKTSTSSDGGYYGNIYGVKR